MVLVRPFNSDGVPISSSTYETCSFVPSVLIVRAQIIKHNRVCFIFNFKKMMKSESHLAGTAEALLKDLGTY